jgi:hypothetical protein
MNAFPPEAGRSAPNIINNINTKLISLDISQPPIQAAI